MTHKQYPVVLDGLCELCKQGDSNQETTDYIKRVFPDGIKFNLNQLTILQQMALYHFGTPYMLLALGELDKIYPANCVKKEDVIIKSCIDAAKIHYSNNCEIKKVKNDIEFPVILVLDSTISLQLICTQQNITYEPIDTIFKEETTQNKNHTKYNREKNLEEHVENLSLDAVRCRSRTPSPTQANTENDEEYCAMKL